MAKLTGKVTKITPAMATKWLEGNTHNRRIYQKTVMEYAQAMKDGLWKLNGATIGFNTDNCLTDGQHRLWACIESKCRSRHWLCTGSATDIFPTIDTGKKRSGGDVLHVSGVVAKNESLVSATASMIIRYENGTINQRQKIPPQVMLDCVKDNPEIAQWVTMMTAKKSWVRAYTTSVAAVAFLASRRYNTKAVEFVEGFVTGENLVAGSPILAFVTA